MCMHEANRRKLDEKAVKMIFVGYDNETKGYRCINKSNRKLTISRDVKFLETPTKASKMPIDETESEGENCGEAVENRDDGNEYNISAESSNNADNATENSPNEPG